MDMTVEAEPQELFAIVPLPTCPHVNQVSQLPAGGIDVETKCAQCPNVGENWVCLSCFEVNCSRFVAAHALDHSEGSEHAMALSFSDLSVWCYPCNAYVDNENEAFSEAVDAARKAKFGENLEPEQQ